MATINISHSKNIISNRYFTVDGRTLISIALVQSSVCIIRIRPKLAINMTVSLCTRKIEAKAMQTETDVFLTVGEVLLTPIIKLVKSASTVIV